MQMGFFGVERRYTSKKCQQEKRSSFGVYRA